MVVHGSPQEIYLTTTNKRNFFSLEVADCTDILKQFARWPFRILFLQRRCFCFLGINIVNRKNRVSKFDWTQLRWKNQRLTFSVNIFRRRTGSFGFFVAFIEKFFWTDEYVSMFAEVVFKSLIRCLWWYNQLSI